MVVGLPFFGSIDPAGSSRFARAPFCCAVAISSSLRVVGCFPLSRASKTDAPVGVAWRTSRSASALALNSSEPLMMTFLPTCRSPFGRRTETSGGEGATAAASPIITVGKPREIVPPCIVGSPRRAAGWPPISTVGEPMMIVAGGPTQVAMSPMRAAGWPPISTVTAPGGRIGPPTCGTGGTDGVTKGQICRSPTLAAGLPTRCASPHPPRSLRQYIARSRRKIIDRLGYSDSPLRASGSVGSTLPAAISLDRGQPKPYRRCQRNSNLCLERIRLEAPMRQLGSAGWVALAAIVAQGAVAQPRGLTFEQRVRAQEAIERLYY